MEEGTGNLQRSVISFRRQGSSGLVWDDKFLTRAHDPEPPKVGNAGEGSSGIPLRQSRSTGGCRPSRTARMPSPSLDPPSPKVSGCGLCGIFGKPVESKHPPNFKGKRKS
ncbi:hypothetical protein MLD38_005752 [Melastoma candidum]|uniref:Uncharacterized protein n=1 Tax=Melastoma candidum TaxID=119954 RepID=A0ACB9RLX5_9MYRT|nr:hypothetical protein MLD38_005752 [Melastoma candidum]